MTLNVFVTATRLCVAEHITASRSLIRNRMKAFFYGFLWGDVLGRPMNFPVFWHLVIVWICFHPHSRSLPQALSECLCLHPTSLSFLKARLSRPCFPPASSLSFYPSSSSSPASFWFPQRSLHHQRAGRGRLRQQAGKDPCDNLARPNPQ